MARDKEKQRAWYQANKERIRESRKAYMEEYRRNNKGKIAEKRRVYRLKNREAITAYKALWDEKNKEHRDQYRSLYQKENAVAVNLRTQKRKALKRAAEIGRVDVSLLLNNMVCGICEEPIEGPYHIDHIIPLAKGGAHAQENLQLAHPSCNIKKRDKILPTKKDPGGSQLVEV